MKMRVLAILGFVLMLGSAAFAQDYPKVEVPIDYSYMRFVPQNNNIVSSFSLNGGGGGLTYYFTRSIGIEAEFEGYGSQTKTFTFPATSTLCPAGCIISAQGNLFTYNVGPVFKYRASHFEPFVEALFGGAHTNVYANVAQDCVNLGICTTSGSPSNNAFDFIIGGGIDIPVNRTIAIRAGQFDYVLTRFGNNFTSGNNNQSNFRFQAGIVFRAGYGKPKAPDTVTASCSVDKSSIVADSGDMIAATASGSDSYNHPIATYTWSATGGKVDGTGPQARWDSTGVAPGTYTISAHLDDGHGASASCSSDVTVNPKPVPPPPTMSCSADPSSVQVGGRSTVTATANDSTGTALTYTWQANSGQVVGTGASVQFDSTGLAAGDYTVTGRVTNGNGAAADCSATVSVQAPPPAPQASKIGSCNFKAGSSKVDNVCKRVLDDAAVRLQNDPKATVVLIGYADPSEKKPDTLSKARGDNASQYLSKTKGVADSRTQSRTAAGTAGAGQENYRVDVMFVPDGATF